MTDRSATAGGVVRHAILFLAGVTAAYSADAPETRFTRPGQPVQSAAHGGQGSPLRIANSALGPW